MCGRYVAPEVAEIERVWHVGRHNQPGLSVEPFRARYNLAPSMDAPVIRQSPEGERVLHWLRWGLVPHWARDSAISNKLNNARAESVSEKPSFRAAYRRRRCLVPALGFYEWQPVPGERKQPWFIRLKSGDPMALGGLWESWTAPDGNILRTFCVVTTAANEVMAPIHDRMPVIVGSADWDTWLDPKHESAEAMLAPFPASAVEAWPVSRRVSSARAEGPDLMEPIGHES